MNVLDLKDKLIWKTSSANFNSTVKINKRGYFYSILERPGEYRGRILSKNISGNGLYYIRVISEDKATLFNKKIKFTSKTWSEIIFNFKISEIHGKCKFLITRDLEGVGRIEIGRLSVALKKTIKLNAKDKIKNFSSDDLIRCSVAVKTAVIVPYGIYGGAEVYLKNIFKHKPMDLDVEFLFLKHNNLINHISSYRHSVLGSLNKLKHKLIMEQYDKVIFYNSKMIYSFILNLKNENLINSDLVEIYHSNFRWSDSLSSIGYRKNILKIIRISDSLCNNIKGDFLLKTIPVSIDVDLFSKKETPLKNLSKFKRHKKIFGLVARLSPEKNIDYAINLFEHLPEYKLVIIGDGPLRSKFQDIIKERALKNIELLGYKENVFEYYNLFDAFLLTSKFEGTPISIIEAMSCGIPVFSTDVGEIKNTFGNLDGINYLTQNTSKDLNILRKPFNTNYLNLRDYVLKNHNSLVNSRVFFEEIAGSSLLYRQVDHSKEMLSGQYF